MDKLSKREIVLPKQTNDKMILSKINSLYHLKDTYDKVPDARVPLERIMQNTILQNETSGTSAIIIL